MAVDKNNKASIYKVLEIEDIRNIPDKHIREFACDIFKGYKQIFEKLRPFGIMLEMGEFQPNGLGEFDYNVHFVKEETNNKDR